MLRSLFSGVSGLRNNQVRMDVIGNNIANVNTVAFKAGRVTFKEGFAQLLAGGGRPRGPRTPRLRMDVIGNNIANVNTVAFKAGRVTFKEGFAQLLAGASRPPGDQGGINPIQVGLGMQVGSIDQLYTQGNIETTGQTTDLAIQGDSLFVVRKGNQRFYTRSGNFQLDADGRLVSPTNRFVAHGRTHEKRQP